ncbi:MAG TPA: hypothetical protein VNL97_05600, partial [Solirubrobacterales bacterium]|nr:hypothetical protein [Solirubrobacterales bacterium]
MADTRELFLSEGATAGSSSGSQHLYVNMGPAHPAMHGIVRIFAELDGETVVKADVEIGYLHRAFEKDCEAGPYNNAIPYTDRLNYVSPLINNFGYSSAIEKLLGIEPPRRAKIIRVLYDEIGRILNHLLNVTTQAMDVGALTPPLWGFEEREKLMVFYERASGSRMHAAYIRPGGIHQDLPQQLIDDIWGFCEHHPKVLDDIEGLLTENRIFKQRNV